MSSGDTFAKSQETPEFLNLFGCKDMKITGYYANKGFDFTNGLSVRDWLKDQSFETQYEFGIKTLKDFGVIK